MDKTQYLAGMFPCRWTKKCRQRVFKLTVLVVIITLSVFTASCRSSQWTVYSKLLPKTLVLATAYRGRVSVENSLKKIK